MNPANVLRVLAWLARDTFRQSVESRVCWFMLALSVVAITICLSVSVQGGAGLQRDGERPDFLPRDDPDAATSQALLKREGVDVPSGDLTIAFGAFRVPLGRDARDAVQFLQFILAGGLASTAGLFLSLVWTAGFLPAFLAPRSITLLLARPVPRSLLYLGKVLGVVLFVVAQATLLVVGTWLALGLRTGVWDGAYLWCLPLLVVEFMVFYSVSALIASHARGVVACVLGSLLFWVVCWGMNFGRHALVAIDTTSMQDRRIVFRAALIYRGRAVPLAWKAVSTRSHNLPFETYEPLLERARTLLPADCTVTLLGDRGFGSVRLMAWCRRRGWHFALRLKGNRSIVLADGCRNRLSAWAVGATKLRLLEGVRLVGAKRHGLGAVNIAITRSSADDSEPWFIVSDRNDALAILADYRCRMNIEHGFKDDKSGALCWEACKMDAVEQVDRHLLIMAVAVLYLVSEGTFLVNTGDLAAVDPHHKRGLSYLKLGFRHIQHALFQQLPIQLKLFLDPAHDPFPVCPYGIPFPIGGRFTWLPGPCRPAGT